MLILADNDVAGAVTALKRLLESDDFAELTSSPDLRFVQFADLALRRDASDVELWRACQRAGAVLVTGNRANGTESLERAIQDYGDSESLPVITIGDPQRLVRDRSNAAECASSLLDLLGRFESLKGTGRLFVP